MKFQTFQRGKSRQGFSTIANLNQNNRTVVADVVVVVVVIVNSTLGKITMCVLFKDVLHKGYYLITKTDKINTDNKKAVSTILKKTQIELLMKEQKYQNLIFNEKFLDIRTKSSGTHQEVSIRESKIKR